MDVINQQISNDYSIYNGDCVELIKQLPDNSVHYSVFSPPFASLYTYSNSDRDMGNCKDDATFIRHFAYLVEELFRVVKPGRLVSVHCMDIPATKVNDGFIGLKDFPGEIIQLFTEKGFYYHSRVTIFKDPLIEATRTHAIGLLHKQIVKDSSMCKQGNADYILTFRKPGENDEPVGHPDGFTRYIGTDQLDDSKVFSHQVWRKYANPIWMDIDQTNTLAVAGSRDPDDERHICPLQLQVIERCIELWSNPGDIVLDPFMGIGSVPYTAVKMDRKGIGFELKESYFKVAKKNMKHIEVEKEHRGNQLDIFNLLGKEAS